MQFKLLNYWFKSMVYKNLAFISIIFIFCSSCALPKGWNDWTLSRPFWGMKNLPSTDTDYGRGFEHGCQHGTRVVSKGMLAEVIGTRLNTEDLINNEQFASGYYDGYEQCTYIQDWDVI